MATETAQVFKAPSGSCSSAIHRICERLFFSSMAILVAAVVVIGFSHSYFAAGILRAPLPNLLVHVHAALFTLWILLFLVQAGLVSARRIGWHRALGTTAYCLPLLMVPLGTVTGLDELRRERVFAAGVATVPQNSAIFLAESLFGIALFAVVIFASWRERRHPASHKRLVLIATIGLASGALIRFPWRAMGLGPLAAQAAVAALALLLLFVAGYDLLTLRHIHRATLWSAPFTLAVSALTVPVANTPQWRAFATFLARHIAPSF